MRDRFRITPPADDAADAPGEGQGSARAFETTLWDLIDPELAGLAMTSLYGTEAPCRMRQMAEACTEAGRSRDSAFWHAALESVGEDAAPGGARILQFPSRTTH